MNIRWSLVGAFVLTGVFLAGCISLCGQDDTPRSGDDDRTTPARAGFLPPGPTEADYPALHNLLQVTDRLYSGGEPLGEASFAQLAALGIKTVVSVDGATPNLELAHKYGLRYIHIPIGYDGIGDAAGKGFAHLAKEAEGPIYVHCHHGRHRGPAAAAVICMAGGHATPDEARAILQKAGTSENYGGLWRDVAAYTPPAEGAVLPELVSVAPIDSLAAAMAKLDRAYDHLKLCEVAGWKTPDTHPDLVPAQEALLIREGLHESGRNLGSGYDARFSRWLEDSEGIATELERALREHNLELAADRFVALKQGCVQCHKAYRN